MRCRGRPDGQPPAVRQGAGHRLERAGARPPVRAGQHAEGTNSILRQTAGTRMVRAPCLPVAGHAAWPSPEMAAYPVKALKGATCRNRRESRTGLGGGAGVTHYDACPPAAPAQALCGPDAVILRQAAAELQMQEAVTGSPDHLGGLPGAVDGPRLPSSTTPDPPARRGRVAQGGRVDGHDGPVLYPPSGGGHTPLPVNPLCSSGMALLYGTDRRFSDRKPGPVRRPDGRPAAVRYAEPVKYAPGHHPGIPAAALKAAVLQRPARPPSMTFSCSVFGNCGLPGLLPSCLPSGHSRSIPAICRWGGHLPRAHGTGYILSSVPPRFPDAAACRLSPDLPGALAPTHLFRFGQLHAGRVLFTLFVRAAFGMGVWGDPCLSAGTAHTWLANRAHPQYHLAWVICSTSDTGTSAG